MKGWDYAVAHPDEAAQIVVDNDAAGAQTEHHQKYMMGEVAKLVGTDPKGTGCSTRPPTTAPSRPCFGQSDPVITKEPEGAWTHDVTDKAATIR